MTDTMTIETIERSTCRAPSRLRIAQITATFPPYWGGTGNVAYHNALELARRGHEVTVFTAAFGDEDDAPVPGVQVRRLAPLLRMGNAPVLPQILGLNGFDIIHLHHPFIFGAEMVWTVAKLRGIPYVVTHHNDLIGDGLRRHLFNLYAAVSAGPIFGGARKLAVVSLDHAAFCRHAPLFRKRWADVVAIPNGVNTRVFRPGLDGDAVRQQSAVPHDAGLILFVGALDRAHHFKGVPHLLSAMAKIRERAAILMIVGDGDLKDHFERLAIKLGVQERIRFVGAVHHDRLAAYYAAADVVVLPSFPPESFGMVLIEAMACGKPVVTHDIPGVRAVVDDGETGLLARTGDSTDLVEKISLLLADPDLRAHMGAVGRAIVESHYDWQVVGERLEQLYFDVLGVRSDAPASGHVPSGERVQ